MQKSELRKLIQEMVKEELEANKSNSSLEENVQEESTYEGSISYDNFLDSLLLANKSGKETLGDLWESLVSCGNCPYKEQCDKLTEMLENLGKTPYCAQLMSIMLGELKIADLK